MKVVHVITGLEVGGAEKVLLQVADRARAHGIEPVIVTLTGRGALSQEAGRRGLEVVALDLRGRRLALGFFRLVLLLRRMRPDLVQTWLYKADAIGGVASRLAKPSCPVVWNVRQANIDPAVNTRATVLAIRCCRLLSRIVPTAVVCVSEEAAAAHHEAGFEAAKLHVIPNGFDVERFRPDPGARAVIRGELGIPADATLVGIVGRVDPQKDHLTFAAASGSVADAVPDVRFVLCGRGTEPGAQPLQGWLEQHGLLSRCHLLGVRDDVPSVLAALDVLVSSSAGEGFANVVGEGMACGLPCVVTAAGNSAELVGDAGAVVPTGDPEKLGDALLRVLELTGEERAQLGADGRERIRTRWSIEACVGRYASFWRAAAGPDR
jgi:glycosyltransferase involved in cell wall biosynthesis